ncbi:MAG TPA: type I restriction endonuclease subunit R [Thermoleophilaceae bacterium]|nr:type I restriction endonuclease subunit R [Thermoleophilaceae bacterium]
MKERIVESAALGWFESLGYGIATGAELSPGAPVAERAGYGEVILEGRLRTALRKVNPHLPADAIDHVVRTVTRPQEPTLTDSNRWFHRILTEGVEVEYDTPAGETRGERAFLVDFDRPMTNDFLVVHELTTTSTAGTRRVDLVVFVNGLPIAVFELKSPASARGDLGLAIRQLQDYKQTIPELFYCNELMVVSDGLETRVGSLTAGPDRYALWRSLSESQPASADLELLIEGLFEPTSLLDYLRHCVTFVERADGEIVKQTAGYHQFRAVRVARDSVRRALRPSGDGRGGVIWHTQGSGKSLTMLMLAGALVADRHLANPTIVVVTDRNDLDAQLFATFAAGRDLIRQPPERATSREDLVERLTRASGGVVFTTIQKFAERDEPVTQRENVVVLADEAHRSQYGFTDGGAHWMRVAIPNGTYVAFTGTPLDRADRNTRAVFGEYADVYDVRRAIEDEATVPIYYEMRLVKLASDQAGVDVAERSLRAALQLDDGSAVPVDAEIPLIELMAAPERVAAVAREIVNHFEARQEAIEGKAMAVCMSREICADLYDAVVALRPEWHDADDEAGAVKVVISGQETQGKLAPHIRSASKREVLARRFKDPEDDLRLVIVCDMWLTGFDCPPMHTMYLDKPLAAHNLMQAIARVNRVFRDKPGGVVVDFLGIADEFRDAVSAYTQAGGEGRPVTEVQKDAVPVMLREHEALCDFFTDFTYSGFAVSSESEQLHAVAAGAEHVLAQDDGKRRFLSMVRRLSSAFALCVPLEETERIRDDLLFFQAVRAAITRRLADSQPTPSDSRAAVRQVIAGAIASEGVIDLFRAAGLRQADVSIFSEEFLSELAGLPQRHLALETLRKLISDELSARERVNIVQSRSFREALDAALNRYANRSITTAQVIDELIALAQALRTASEHRNETGMTAEEEAFYDALADNASAREVMQDETLRLLAQELITRIQSKATLDWTKREAVRADMRRTVRRLLAKYGYPPDAHTTATQLVLRQAELLAENALAPNLSS